MGKLFDLDSPLMRVLNKAADLMWLNILVIFCSLPVFTAGAALTAAHYVALKLRRNEEGYISKEFFKAFKMNFKQATLIWLMLLGLGAIFATDFYIMRTNEDLGLPQIVQILVMVAFILYIFLLVWVFPMQAKFINNIKRTLKNALAMSMIQLPKTILMILFYVLPWVLLWFALRLFPIVLVYCFSIPIFGSAVLYNKIFKTLEDRILSRQAEENGKTEENAQEEDSERIFSDEPLLKEENSDVKE